VSDRRSRFYRCEWVSVVVWAGTLFVVGPLVWRLAQQFVKLLDDYIR
jgi:hypothetical protein